MERLTWLLVLLLTACNVGTKKPTEPTPQPPKPAVLTSCLQLRGVSLRCEEETLRISGGGTYVFEHRYVKRPFVSVSWKRVSGAVYSIVHLSVWSVTVKLSHPAKRYFAASRFVHFVVVQVP